MEQITISQWVKLTQIPGKPPRKSLDTEYLTRVLHRPTNICYECRHALKRGLFRDCAVGGKGYKYIGHAPAACEYFEEVEHDDSANCDSGRDNIRHRGRD